MKYEKVIYIISFIVFMFVWSFAVLIAELGHLSYCENLGRNISKPMYYTSMAIQMCFFLIPTVACWRLDKKSFKRPFLVGLVVFIVIFFLLFWLAGIFFELAH